MEKLIIGVLGLFLLGCTQSKSSYKVEDMTFEHVEFQGLPFEVRNYIIHSDTIKCFTKGSFVLMNSSDSAMYEFTLNKSKFTPWINQEQFTKHSQGTTYELEVSTPAPFIIFGDSLYIPCQYNSLSWIQSPDNLSFKKYNLSEQE